jgi:hypothetical protein
MTITVLLPDLPSEKGVVEVSSGSPMAAWSHLKR